MELVPVNKNSKPTDIEADKSHLSQIQVPKPLHFQQQESNIQFTPTHCHSTMDMDHFKTVHDTW